LSASHQRNQLAVSTSFENPFERFFIPERLSRRIQRETDPSFVHQRSFIIRNPSALTRKRQLEPRSVYKLADCLDRAQRQSLSMGQHAGQAMLITCTKFRHAIDTDRQHHNVMTDSPNQYLHSVFLMTPDWQWQPPLSNVKKEGILEFCVQQKKEFAYVRKRVILPLPMFCNSGRRRKGITSTSAVNPAYGQITRESLVKIRAIRRRSSFVSSPVSRRCPWALEGGQWGLSPGFWKFQQKKVVFLVSSGKKINLTTSDLPLGKFWKKTLVASPGNYPSDTHAGSPPGLESAVISGSLEKLLLKW